MARACLALGDWQGKNKRHWYERGERAAERALALKEDSADTHFFLAANRGNVVNLQPFWKVSPMIVADLEGHLRRALELEPRHARALHMMGILLDRTPGLLRLLLAGKKAQVEDYLKRAVEADADRYAYPVESRRVLSGCRTHRPSPCPGSGLVGDDASRGSPHVDGGIPPGGRGAHQESCRSVIRSIECRERTNPNRDG